MELSAKIKKCKKCTELATTRTNVVIGQGPIPCSLIFLGEAPGRTEDQTGIPFCGIAGNILEAAAFRVGFKRNRDYHILNVLKCRPPENRDPTLEELENCKPYLLKQIEGVKPKIIMAFGRYAQAFVLDTPPTKIKVLQGVGQVVETRFNNNDKPILAVLSYHPAYVARNRDNDIAKAFNNHFKITKNLLRGKP